jgi:hypothetical protein
MNGFIKAIRLNGAPLPDRVLDFTNGAEGARLEITLSANGGQITGWVEDEEGTPSSSGTVFLFSDPQNGDGSDDWRDARLSLEGGYGFGGLRPGRYRLLVTPRTFDIVHDLRVFARHNHDSGQLIEIKGEGAKISRDLIMPGEDEDETKK